MPDWITVEGVRPYDGRYELSLDESPFTIREWGWIKRYAGYLPTQLDRDAVTDPELMAVQAIIAIYRQGRLQPGDVADLWERFADLPPLSAIRYEFEPAGEDGDADDPPAASSNGKPSISGDPSTTDSATSDEPLSRTGSPASATSVSAPPTSAS